MEPQNTAPSSSSHHYPLLSSNFAAAAASTFPVKFAAGLNAVATATSNNSNGNVSSPLFMSTLQQLSGLSNTGFLPSNSQFSSIGNQLSTDLSNWNSQSVWLDQAKMAAMLPMYLQNAASNSNDHSQLQQTLSRNNLSIPMEQNLKNQTSAISNASTYESANNNHVNYNMQFDTVKEKANHLPLNIANECNGSNSSISSPSSFCSTNVVQQQRPISRIASQQQQQQQQFPTNHRYHQSTQSPLTGGPNSVGSPLNSNSNRVMPTIHHGSYPPSNSSHPPSNEGMVESPLSTYSNIAQHHHLHEQQAADVCSNSPYNYQNSFIQQQQTQQTTNNKQAKLASPLGSMKRQISNLVYHHQQQSFNINNSSPNVSVPITNSTLQQQQATSILSDNTQPKHFSTSLASVISINDSINQPNLHQQQQQQQQQQQSHSTDSIAGGHPVHDIMTITSTTSNIVPEGNLVADNVEDLSVLDLHDFEEFLNDKDVVSAALSIDPAALFNSTNNGSGNTAGINDLNLPTASISQSATSVKNQSLDNRKNPLLTTNSLITSAKMRERIHERRAEELANADKELDRLVSLVARQNDAKMTQSQSSKPNSMLSIFNFDLLNSLKQPTSKITVATKDGSSSPTMLNPVQFTPPDSPTNFSSNNAARNLAAATSLASSLLASLKAPKLNALASSVSKPWLQKLSHSVDGQLSSTNEPPSPALPCSLAVTSKNLCITKENKETRKSTPLFPLKNHQEQQPFVFIPKMDSLPSKSSTNSNKMTKNGPSNASKACYNRVPIYKQHTKSSIFASNNSISSAIIKGGSGKSLDVSSVTMSKLSKKKSDLSADAYSFTDDEEEMAESSLVIPQNFIPTTSAQTSSSSAGVVVETTAPIKSKAKSGDLAKQSQTVYIPGVGYTMTPMETTAYPEPRHSAQPVRKRRTTQFTSERTSGSSVAPASNVHSLIPENEVPSAIKPANQLPLLADEIRRRRFDKYVFLRVELDNNDNDAISTEFMDDALSCSGTPSSTATGYATITHRQPTVTCRIKIENPEDAEDRMEDHKSLPKLVIKFIKPEVEQCNFNEEQNYPSEWNDFHEKSKKKKKRKKKERDREWNEDFDEEGHRRHKKHKKHKKEKRRHSMDDRSSSTLITENSLLPRHYSLDQSIPISNDMNDFGTDENQQSKKRRLDDNIIESNDEIPGLGLAVNNLLKDDESQLLNSPPNIDNVIVVNELSAEEFLRAARQTALGEISNEFVGGRLNCFSKANGNLPKGTFLIAKDDAFKLECPLWKIDNQNLLQKYPPISLQSNGLPIRYRNSSTYSGWCDKIADDYLVIGVKFVKQSRAENIVEPIIAICDLFPAVCTEILGSLSALGSNDANECGSNSMDSVAFSTKDSLKDHLKVFVKAMLKHAVSLDFLSLVKSSNDWNYLCALNEVERQITDAKAKVTYRAKWTHRFEKVLNCYTNYSSSKLEISHELCQACGIDNFSMSIQLFISEQCHDIDVIGATTTDYTFFESLPAMEFMVCSGCEYLASLYHRNQHMRFNIFKKCEDKLEIISSEFTTLTPDALVQQCLMRKNWLNDVRL